MGSETGVVMQAVTSRGGRWRVQMIWPKRPKRYFGRFDSKAEAERWIAEHRWLAVERQAEPPES